LPFSCKEILQILRLTPTQLRGDDVLSIGGQNNRFNAIYIDGAVVTCLVLAAMEQMVGKQELAQYLLIQLSNFK
jgi:hypothetical protein